MSDIYNKEKRTEIMSRIPSKGNRSTEEKLIELFKKHRITGWRRNYKVKGRPDFVFLDQRIAVFVDGCFWHGHDCRNAVPKANAEFWRKKHRMNFERDQYVNALFIARGWEVVRIWECELKKNALPDKLLSLSKPPQ